MTNRPNTIAALEWLAQHGGRARHVALLHPDEAENVDLDAAHLLVAPTGQICPVRPSTLELTDDYWFTLYSDEEGAEWVCISIHPEAYSGLVAEARKSLAIASAA